MKPKSISLRSIDLVCNLAEQITGCYDPQDRERTVKEIRAIKKKLKALVKSVKAHA